MTWEQLEKQYGIKFKLEDGTFRPVNEWLDDLYLLFSPQEVIELINEIMENGQELFKNLLKHK